LHLLHVEPDDPPLGALRVAVALATNEMGTPGVSVMTYVRLEDGRPGAAATVDVVDAVAGVLGVDAARMGAAIQRSRGNHAALASSRD
jgi:hypothetical protein